MITITELVLLKDREWYEIEAYIAPCPIRHHPGWFLEFAVRPSNFPEETEPSGFTLYDEFGTHAWTIRGAYLKANRIIWVTLFDSLEEGNKPEPWD